MADFKIASEGNWNYSLALSQMGRALDGQNSFHKCIQRIMFKNIHYKKI